MKQFKLLLPLLVLVGCISCKREVPQVAPIDTNFSGAATVQIFNGTVKAARNYVYVDGTVVSGTAFTYQGAFPGTSYGIKLDAGTHAIQVKDTLSTTTQQPLNFSQAYDAGKSYTVFMYDTITSPKEVTVTNAITVPTDTTCMLRFGNFVYNATPVANVDVYSYRRGGAPVFSNVATGQVTPFIPYASVLTDTLYVYATGTTSPLVVKSFVTSLTPTRSYTSVYNGSYKGTKAVTTFLTY